MFAAGEMRHRNTAAPGVDKQQNGGADDAAQPLQMEDNEVSGSEVKRRVSGFGIGLELSFGKVGLY